MTDLTTNDCNRTIVYVMTESEDENFRKQIALD